VPYRQALASREFRALAISQGLSILGDQVARIAVALLVYERSGSAFAASATYACSYLTWLVGGPVLAAVSDRYPRRTVMVVCDLLRATLVAVLMTTPPLWAVFALVIAIGLLAPSFDSARAAVLPDVLPAESFVAGNTIMNFLLQTGQAVGFLFGGALVALFGTRGALLADVLTFLVSAAALMLFVQGRPAGDEPRRFLLHEAADGMRLVRRTPQLRRLLGWAALSAAVVIAPEGLAVAVAADRGGGAVAAGVLTGSVPLGFLVGGLLLLRGDGNRHRTRLPAFMVMSCVPLLLTPLVPSIAGIAGLWVCSGIGSVLQLVASTEYLSSTPRDFRARSYGVAVTALMTVQGVVLLAAGRLAELVDPRVVVAVVAAGGLAATPLLVRTGGHAGVTQGTGDSRRDQRG
jgi:MFS family permease